MPRGLAALNGRDPPIAADMPPRTAHAMPHPPVTARPAHAMVRRVAPMLTPLNLTTSVLCGPLVTRSKVGVVAPTWPNSSRSAIRASRWPARFSPWVPTWMRVVEFQVDDRDDGRVGHPLRQQPLGLLDGVPALGVAAADEPADLDEVERQLGLAEVGPDGGDEVGRRPAGRPSRPRPLWRRSRPDTRARP